MLTKIIGTTILSFVIIFVLFYAIKIAYHLYAYRKDKECAVVIVVALTLIFGTSMNIASMYTDSIHTHILKNIFVVSLSIMYMLISIISAYRAHKRKDYNNMKKWLILTGLTIIVSIYSIYIHVIL